MLRSQRFLLSYLGSLLAVALVTMLGVWIRDLITPTNLVMPYLLVVVGMAFLSGLGPAVFASVLGVLAFDIFLIPPYLTLVVEDTEYVITFIALFIVGVLISSLTSQVKEQVSKARERELRITALYQLSQKLAVAYTLEGVVAEILMSIDNMLHQQASMFLVNFENPIQKDQELYPYQSSSGSKPKLSADVILTFQEGKPTGYGTDFFPDLISINFPLKTSQGILGVLSIEVEGDASEDIYGQTQQLEAFVTLAAMALERVYLSKQASQTQLLKAKDDLQSALLNSVSHDFRTPLVTITGTLSSLNSELHSMEPATQQTLIQQARNEAEKLNRLVSNLLNMSRLESGGLVLQIDFVDLQDLIGSTLQRMEGQLDHPVEINVPETIPLIEGDFVLLEQALMNLLDNAQKFSPEKAAIEVVVRTEESDVLLEVADRGPGVNEEELSRIYDKFYQVQDKQGVGGSGLGLAIVKGILDAHQAEIKTINRPGGGLMVRLRFPAYKSDGESN